MHEEEVNNQWSIVKRKHVKNVAKEEDTLHKNPQKSLVEVENQGGGINFFYGNSSTHITRGIIHLYKENIPQDIGFREPQRINVDNNFNLDMICVLAIPLKYTTHKFLKFLEPFLASMSYIKIVRDDSPNHYIALIKFDNTEHALEFYLAFNGVPFSSNIKKSSCPSYHNKTNQHKRVVPKYFHSLQHIDDLEDTSHKINHFNLRPSSKNETLDKLSSTDSIVMNNETTHQEKGLHAASSLAHGDLFVSSSADSNDCYNDVCHLVFVSRLECERVDDFSAFPPPGVAELPKCIVCMERMEESMDGVLTVLCNHSFHTHCLAQWKDSSCPVCRSSLTGAPSNRDKKRQMLDSTATGGQDEADLLLMEDGGGQSNECMEPGCESRVDLWICLICGNVGCGRYLGAHASKHFETTQHTYAMELESRRVWDYAGDNYVHRLIQNRADGKIVEFVRGRPYFDSLTQPSPRNKVRKNRDPTYVKKGEVGHHNHEKEKSLGTVKGGYNELDNKSSQVMTAHCKSCFCHCDLNDTAIMDGIKELDDIIVPVKTTDNIFDATVHEKASENVTIIVSPDQNRPFEKVTVENTGIVLSEQHSEPNDNLLCDQCGQFRTLNHDKEEQSKKSLSSPSESSSSSSSHSEDEETEKLIRPSSRERNNISDFPLYDEIEKLDSISLEYSYLMSQQLTSQSSYFKGEIAQIENEYVTDLTKLQNELQLKNEQFKGAETELETCKREKEKVERKYATLSGKFEKLTRDLLEERELNRSLTLNQECLRTKLVNLENQLENSVKTKDVQIGELNEQIRDLMFHFTAQSQISTSNMGQELQDGTLILPHSSTESTNHPSSSRRRRRQHKSQNTKKPE